VEAHSFYIILINYIQISFPDLKDEQKEILIALLADSDFEGFEEITNGLNTFISESRFNRTLLKEISNQYKIDFNEKNISPAKTNGYV